MLMESRVGHRPDVIGFGTPGTSDPATGLLGNSNSVCLNGMPLRADLESLLGVHVVLANDANCFALAEASFGAAAGAATVFGVIMGTGVGGGVVVDGKVLHGAQGIAGEWGHNELEPGGYDCYCGKKGCVETVLSGPFLERFYFGKSGVRLRLPEIVERARQGHDEAAIETMTRLNEYFGKAISVIVNILDPDVIVLGGGVGKTEELYVSGVESMRKWVFNDDLRTRVLKPTLGDSAGVFGAAQLARDLKL
jgi:predicted NBD/HSP70 family sugar kinase